MTLLPAGRLAITQAPAMHHLLLADVVGLTAPAMQHPQLLSSVVDKAQLGCCNIHTLLHASNALPAAACRDVDVLPYGRYALLRTLPARQCCCTQCASQCQGEVMCPVITLLVMPTNADSSPFACTVAASETSCCYGLETCRGLEVHLVLHCL